MKKLLLIFIPLLINTVYGQKSYTLAEAKKYALEHSEDVKNAKLDLQIAEKKIWETTANGLPQVSAKLDFQNFIDIPTTVIPASTFNPMAPAGEVSELKMGTEYNVNGSLQVSQLLFSGNYLVGLQASKAYSNTSKQMVEKQEIEVQHLVAEAYYTVLLLKKNKSTLDSTLLNIEKLYSDTKILVDEKVIEATSALQLELSVMQIKNTGKQIDNQISVAKNLLKFQMGLPVSENITLTEELSSFLENQEPLIDGSLNASNNIDYKLEKK